MTGRAAEPPMPRAVLTLRRFLLLAVAVGMGYVAMIGLLLAVRVVPGARLLRHDSELLLAEHDQISARLADQRRTVAEIRLMIDGRASPAAAAALSETVRARLDSVLAIDAAARSRLPDDVRLALARATESETRLGERLLQALAALQVGNAGRGRQRLAAAESALLIGETDLAAAQRLALADMVRREDELTGMALGAARSVLAWLVVGSGAVLLAALFMRRRFFDPLQDLEAGLSRVAAGDLSVSVPTHRADEIGRLAAHLNTMTEVLRSAGREEVARRERLRAALTRFWEQSGVVIGGDLHEALEAVTATAGPALEVGRASVWLYDEKRSAFRCEDLYERSAGRHSRGETLFAPEHPVYFEAIAAGRTVAADDAVTDSRTATFTQGYLQPHGISALLDAGISVRGRLAGLVSFEHQGPPRRWTEDEQSFASSVADFVSLILEAAERSRAEQALRRSEERYRAAFEQAAVGFVETDLEGGILQVNPRFCSLLGYAETELMGQSFVGLAHAEHQDDGRRAMRRLAVDEIAFHEAEQRFRRKDAGTVWARVTVAPVHGADGSPQFLLAVVENITERRNLETQLVRAQKMESIGRLAGGVAHDFNNLLTAIIGYAEAARAASRDPELGSDLDEVLRAAGRGAELTRQLLTFARNHVVEPRLLDVNELMRGMDKLLRRLIGEHIELHADLADGLGSVRADPAQLEQVVVNLVVNARDAMPGGGKLEIETGQLVVGGDDALPRRLDAPPGRYVQVAVSDSGVGMDENVQARLFEPFFTTKAPDKGTGLGLAICYGIVRQAGGFIAVYSEPGKGSTFRVCLPQLDAKPAPALAPDRDGGDERGDETVLLAEDDPQIRRLGARALRARGYQVLEAADGEQAVERAAEASGAIHLLVTDVVLPRMSGPELSKRLRGSRPDIRVIFISGYTRGALSHVMGEVDHRFLPKPFTPRQLVHLVRETLDAGT